MIHPKTMISENNGQSFKQQICQGSLRTKRFHSSYAGAKIRVKKQKTKQRQKKKTKKGTKKLLFFAFVPTYMEMLATQAMPG